MSALAPQSQTSISPSLDRERLLLQRAHDMLVKRLAGKTNLELSLEYGISLDAIEDAIRMGMNEALSKAQEETVNSALITQLALLNAELADIDRQLPLMGIRRAQAFNSRGEVAWLEEEISNVNAKVKIKSERRQTVMAINMVRKSRTEDPPDASRARDLQEIGSIFGQVTQELVGEATRQAQERGRLEERLTTEVFVEPSRFTEAIGENHVIEPEPETDPEPERPDSGTPDASPAPAVPGPWD